MMNGVSLNTESSRTLILELIASFGEKRKSVPVAYKPNSLHFTMEVTEKTWSQFEGRGREKLSRSLR